jgi:hypothetical protein
MQVRYFFSFTFSEGGLKPYRVELSDWRRFLKHIREPSEANGTSSGPL